MGFFSWRTGDTDESIPNTYSSRATFTVYLILPDNTKYEETAYEGYGVFGGKDIFEVIAKLNGKKTRDEGIDIAYKDPAEGDFLKASQLGYAMPKLARSKDVNYDNLPYPKNCEYQGYFYDEYFEKHFDKNVIKKIGRSVRKNYVK